MPHLSSSSAHLPPPVDATPPDLRTSHAPRPMTSPPGTYAGPYSIGDRPKRTRKPPQLSNTARHVSCSNCRLRKVKCSRTAPCVSCEMRGEECVWENASPSRSNDTEGIDEALAEIDHLRTMVAHLSTRLSRLDGQPIAHTPGPIQIRSHQRYQQGGYPVGYQPDRASASSDGSNSSHSGSFPCFSPPLFTSPSLPSGPPTSAAFPIESSESAPPPSPPFTTSHPFAFSPPLPPTAERDADAQAQTLLWTTGERYSSWGSDHYNSPA